MSPSVGCCQRTNASTPVIASESTRRAVDSESVTLVLNRAAQIALECQTFRGQLVHVRGEKTGIRPVFGACTGSPR
jgi:hypothetical protein